MTFADADGWADTTAITAALAEATPMWEPGTFADPVAKVGFDRHNTRTSANAS